MKITIESYGNTFSWENEGDDTNLAELIPQIKGLLVSAGYHPKSVDEGFAPDAYEWFPEVRKVEDYLESEGFKEIRAGDNRDDFYHRTRQVE
jgi:hypothetical protein